MMEALLSGLTVLCAMSAAMSRRAAWAVAAVVGTALSLAARIAIEDPLLAAVVILLATILGPVSLLHLRRHEAVRDGERSLLPFIMGLGLILTVISMPTWSSTTATEAPQPGWPTTGLVVLVAAVALLIGATLVVRIREGRRQ